MKPRIWVWPALSVVTFILAIGIPIGFTLTYVHNQLAHSCQALELLTARPVPKPTAGSGESRKTVYRFYESLVYWRDADGCKP